MTSTMKNIRTIFYLGTSYNEEDFENYEYYRYVFFDMIDPSLDVYNKKKERTVENTPIGNYNCLGYALGIYLWGNVIRRTDTAECFFEELGKPESEYNAYTKRVDELLWQGRYDAPEIMELMTFRLERAFPQLRRINSLDEIKEGEYGIAFAAGCEDFHFARIDDGIITNKSGDEEIEVVENFDDCFAKYGYNSEIILYAKEK